MDCACCISPKRRRLLVTMAALAAGLASGPPATAATPTPTATGTAGTSGAPGTLGKGPSIDIHAHCYPESHCVSAAMRRSC